MLSTVISRVLVVDDDEEMCQLIERALSKKTFTVTTRRSGADAVSWLAHDDADVVVTDLNMKGMNGLELCERVVQGRPDVPVVVITAFGSLDTAVAAIRAGAYDFITKPFEMDTLRLTLERASRHRALTQEVVRLRQVAHAHDRFEELIGDSEPMRALFDLINRVAETDASVLVTGESGTGKELVAHAIHARSRRKDGKFVAINCAAMPESLLESELFGHARGAFTDARTARTGLFVQASGGTLLLDEIAEMSPGLQAKLLRALQERVVRPVGSDEEVPFDARVVTATHRDLETLIEQGNFREDLYYRINVVPVALPPLRARGRDVLVLAQAFLERFAQQAGKPVRGLSAPAADKLLGYRWPGNVRELGNCIERAVALTRFAEITVEDLPEKIRDYRKSHVVLAADSPAELVPLDEVERRYILHVLDQVGGSRTIASRVLGLDRKTLYRRLKAYGVGGDE
jgi:two-component system response regulator AtoC